MPLDRICGHSVQREAKRGLLALRLFPGAHIDHLRFALIKRGAIVSLFNRWCILAECLRQSNVMGCLCPVSSIFAGQNRIHCLIL